MLDPEAADDARERVASDVRQRIEGAGTLDRVDWREGEAQGGSKRQAVEIIANRVQFLGSRSDNQGGGGGNGFQPSSDVPADTSDFEGASVSSGGGSDDDIPF